MGGGAYARFFMRTRKGGLCQIFLFVIEKKLGEGGYTQIFGVYSKYITAWGGGGIMPDFFMCTRKLLGRGSLYPNFWCVLKEYY